MSQQHTLDPTRATLVTPMKRADVGLDPWLFTQDHKRLAKLYAIVIALAVVVGAFLSVGLALQPIAGQHAGTSADEYRRLYSMHGLVMVFLVALPAIPGVLGNWLLPELLGVERMAWPRLNLLAFHLLLAGCALFLVAFLAAPVDTGWSFDVPFAVTSGASLSWSLFAILTIAVSYACNALNVLATLVTSRKGERDWLALPTFAWSLGLASIAQLLALPVLIGALVILLAQRAGATDVLGAASFASDVRFSEWFWFFAHPAFTAALLCALGAVAEILASHTATSNIARRSTIFCLVAISVFSFAGFGVHSLGRGSSPDSAAMWSALALLSGVPFAVLVAQWWSMLWQGPLRTTAALCYALCFVVFLVIGGLAGLFLAVLPTGLYLASTTFATAQFHYLIAGGLLTAALGGVYHVWPRWFGARVSEGKGIFACALLFIGVNLAFFPYFVLGFLAAPRRTGSIAEAASQWSWISAIGSALVVIALALAGWNLIASLLQERETSHGEART